jgi:LAS superfamily LD-carboxypeptidase LdcB
MRAESKKPLLLVLGSLVILALIGSGVYEIHKLKNENSSLQNSLASAQSQLSASDNENVLLSEQLLMASSTINAFAGQVATITSSLGDYQKLSQIDPELLKKYSKVSFLNENYVPASLTNIDPNFISGDKTLQFLTDAWPFLDNLLLDASSTGLKLEVVSAYRSFGEQGNLKSSYDVTYGAGTANQFSAEQGYSEHQLGTAVDFTSAKLGSNFTNFASTPEFTWLSANAYRYGFILSYPPKNSYYVYEPWHWRFVGIQLAELLHSENKYFYDLDQREIDTYLLHLFDFFN